MSDVAYVPPRGMESLRVKLTRNGEARNTYQDPEWDEVRVIMRELEEAERVLRVISGWNTDRVDTETAIQPALGYFAAKEAHRDDE